jgi:hypothetical protein
MSSCLLPTNIEFKVYRNIILPVVFYGCKTCSFTMGKKHKLRVFENRVLRKIFGPKRDEVMGKGRRMHKEKHCDLYS